jgi:ribosomal protein L11 methyltransferase
MRADYFEIEIAPTKSNYEVIYNLLYLEGIRYIIEENGVIKVCFKNHEQKQVTDLVKKLLKIHGLAPNDIDISRLKSHDWYKAWQNSINPVYIKNKIIIYPSWKKNSIKHAKGKILIEIDPKMSFGTGHNETTQMMLEMMCDYLKPNDKYMLDYGCGTGILAIAGVKLGVKASVAIDIDNDSINNANSYILKNNTAKNIKLYKADIAGIDETGFDVIVSNIDLKVITKNLKQIRAKLKIGGKLFVSGVLVNERDKLVQKLRRNKFKIIETREKAEWVAFYARNNGS